MFMLILHVPVPELGVRFPTLGMSTPSSAESQPTDLEPCHAAYTDYPHSRFTPATSFVC